MEGISSKIGLLGVTLTGFLGFYLVTKDKTRNKTVADTPSNLQILYFLEAQEAFEAEIIGDYVAHGVGGSIFRLPSGEVMKVVSLENDLTGENGVINQDQADFIEDMWLKQLEGKDSFIPEFAEIKHYNRVLAGPRMTALVNSESPAYEKRPLRVGERIAYWVMEYIPTIGNGDMTDEKVILGQHRVKQWGKKNGYTMMDFHKDNYGERADGSFVAFDPWPSKD